MMVDEAQSPTLPSTWRWPAGDVDDEKSYIWPDVDEDDAGMFRLINWRLKSEFDPPPKAEVDPPEEVERMAARAREELDKQLPKEVRDLLLQQIAKEFTVDTTEPDDEKKGGGA